MEVTEMLSIIGKKSRKCISKFVVLWQLVEINKIVNISLVGFAGVEPDGDVNKLTVWY